VAEAIICHGVAEGEAGHPLGRQERVENYGLASQTSREYLDKVYLIEVYWIRMAIQGFSSRSVERFFVEGVVPKRAGWAGVSKVAGRKLDMLDYAHQLMDLKSPPGNRLEALKGDLSGFHSIRINDQWRVIFRWTDSGPTDVDIRDYH